MKYLKYFSTNADYQQFINGEGDEIFLPNVSFCNENSNLTYKPIINEVNMFSGVISIDNLSDYDWYTFHLFNHDVLPLSKIKSIKINGNEVEIATGYDYSFFREGDNEYVVELNEPLNDVVNLFGGIYVEDSESNYWESYLHYVKKIDISSLKTQNINKTKLMFTMFKGDEIIGLDKLNTSQVTDMYRMFLHCASLTSLDDISNWDTSNVNNMLCLFENCEGLTSLNLSKWDTSNVTDMNGIFLNCYSLTSLNSISNWRTSNVTDMGDMFFSCSSLTSLDLSNWDTSKVTNMASMFGGCSSLTSLDLSNWDTSNVGNMSQMFAWCNNLTEVRMGGDVSNVHSMYDMFWVVDTTGTFYYNAAYDYSKIIAELPSTWTAVPCTMVDGVLIPNE